MRKVNPSSEQRKTLLDPVYRPRLSMHILSFRGASLVILEEAVEPQNFCWIECFGIAGCEHWACRRGVPEHTGVSSRRPGRAEGATGYSTVDTTVRPAAPLQSQLRAPESGTFSDVASAPGAERVLRRPGGEPNVAASVLARPAIAYVSPERGVGVQRSATRRLGAAGLSAAGTLRRALPISVRTHVRFHRRCRCSRER